MHQTHIVLTLGRSGSNTLVDMLNQNPAILNYGEVLGEWNRIRKFQRRTGLFRNDDRAYLDSILDNPWLLRLANTNRSISKLARGRMREVKRIGNLKTVGFKEFSLNFDRYGLGDYVRTRRDAKIIALTRSNVIERMVSNEFLQATGIVSSQTKGAKGLRPKLSITPEKVIEKLVVIEKETQKLEEMVADLDQSRVLRMEYADLYNDPDHTIAIVRRAYEFLGVPDMKPKVRMSKLVKRDPLAALENGNEVRAAIEQTRFATFLH